jgi:hypothetical protein
MFAKKCALSVLCISSFTSHAIMLRYVTLEHSYTVFSVLEFFVYYFSNKINLKIIKYYKVKECKLASLVTVLLVIRFYFIIFSTYL